jgi:hypothetical protein
MVSAIRLSLLLVCVSVVCAFADPKPRMSKEQVIAVAKHAIAATFPWSTAKHYRYDAFFQADGTWGVYVPHPGQPNMLGGGDPNAEVRDRDGKVLKVYLAR